MEVRIADGPGDPAASLYAMTGYTDLAGSHEGDGIPRLYCVPQPAPMAGWNLAYVEDSQLRIVQLGECSRDQALARAQEHLP